MEEERPTLDGISVEWAVPPPLVANVVLLLKREQFLLH
jgi:hypothetical protein